ncbi:MAG: cytochrome B6 [Synechococcus sp.]|nr:cytochrome B6 [Synechococcus sp.]
MRIDEPMQLFGYATVGDPGPMPFGLNLAGLQNGVLVYLVLSGLVFVIIWIVGYLRRS